MNHVLITIILSILPISELRGGIPYALAEGIAPINAFLIAVTANIIIIFFIFFFLDYIHKHLMNFKFYNHPFNWYIERIRKKTHKNIASWTYLALFFLVAVPLPGTGAYTGCLASWLFDLERKKSILAIILGIITAGLIITFIGSSIINLF